MTTHNFVNIIRHLVIYLLVLNLGNVGTAPPDYCLQPLNKSNCNLKPTPVFSYYLSGSRCEVEYWRGCPTLNKFENQYECTFTCIFALGRRPVVEEPSDNNLFKELMQIPEENLTIIDDIIKEIDDEIVKLHITLPTTTEPAIDTTNTKAETTPVSSEEKHEEEEASPEKPESSYESGLPDEVETP